MKTICVKDEGFQSLRLKKKTLKSHLREDLLVDLFSRSTKIMKKVQIKPDNSDFANLIEIVKNASA